jgi:hypothetical protein
MLFINIHIKSSNFPYQKFDFDLQNCVKHVNMVDFLISPQVIYSISAIFFQYY